MNVGITFFVQGTAKLQKSGQQEMVSRFCALPRPEVQHHLQHPPDSGYSPYVRHTYCPGQRQGLGTSQDHPGSSGSSGNGKTFPGRRSTLKVDLTSGKGTSHMYVIQTVKRAATLVARFGLLHFVNCMVRFVNGTVRFVLEM